MPTSAIRRAIRRSMHSLALRSLPKGPYGPYGPNIPSPMGHRPSTTGSTARRCSVACWPTNPWMLPSGIAACRSSGMRCEKRRGDLCHGGYPMSPWLSILQWSNDLDDLGVLLFQETSKYRSGLPSRIACEWLFIGKSIKALVCLKIGYTPNIVILIGQKIQ